MKKQPPPRRRKGKREQLKESSYSDETPLLLGVCSGIQLKGEPCPCFAVVCLHRLLLCSAPVREREIESLTSISSPIRTSRVPLLSFYYFLFFCCLPNGFSTSKSPPVTNESAGIDRRPAIQLFEVCSRSCRYVPRRPHCRRIPAALFLQTSLHHLGRRYEVELAHTESRRL